MIKLIETIGTGFGMLGAFIVAMEYGQYGYPVFIISTACLLYSSVKQKQHNYIKLQLAFLASNLVGVFNYVF